MDVVADAERNPELQQFQNFKKYQCDMWVSNVLDQGEQITVACLKKLKAH